MSALPATPETCPVCGETVPRGAKACPGCGADERSGWDEEATRYDSLDLPDEAWADDSAGPRRARRPVPTAALIAIAVIALIAVVIRFALP